MRAQLIGVALGIWLMASPAVFGLRGPARISALIAGPLAASLSWIALSEVTRPVRRLNLVIGLWLVASALLFRQPTTAAINSAVTGILLGSLALLRTSIQGRYGGGWCGNA